MAKNLHISVLLDFYGRMLTDKQREVIELYYNEDLSLAEIAEHSGITRQGVRDSIKRAEGQLLDCEDKLALYRQFSDIRGIIGEIATLSGEISQNTTYLAGTEDIRRKSQLITELAAKIELLPAE